MDVKVASELKGLILFAKLSSIYTLEECLQVDVLMTLLPRVSRNVQFISVFPSVGET